MNENAIDRKLVCAFIDGLISDDGERKKGLEYIRNMPPVNPQSCEDAISRAEAIKIASGYCHPANVAKELAKLPSVNPQPCEDAISRQAVQDYVAKYLSQYLYNDVREAVEVIDEYIGELPSVNPQPKTGEWNTFELFQSGIKETWYECPKCKWSNALLIPRNYCPNCGARMERSDKE